MAEHFPWLVAPRNKKEFDELEHNFQEAMEELYTKLQIVAAQTNHRLRHPKGGSKWAQKLAWARVDLRIYARSVTKPMAGSGAAAIACGKSFRRGYTNFYEIHTVAAPKNGGGSGFDFE